MIFAPADAHPCIPICNLSTTHRHYGTYTNLCSTIKSTYGTYCNLSTAINPNIRRLSNLNTSGTLNSLSSNIIHPF